MKKVLSLVMFLSVAMFAMAQVEAVPAPAAMDGPIMTFDAMELDYGLIEQGSEPLRTFHFKNTGTKVRTALVVVLFLFGLKILFCQVKAMLLKYVMTLTALVSLPKQLR